ncbi:hypothetical protein MNBD_ALPHA09-333 [hydrothermal vent metagenome]|uniref:Periplasmic nitrate reductase component NapD n=1 Tax=hydrothermal vent metagenome TaxID=652676 RepID=A0A3B0TIL3_9ZZZZ
MNIAGILVNANPGEQDTVRTALSAMEGVELHHETDDGRFIITVEDTEASSCDRTVLTLHNAAGVASAALAFHSFETEDTNASVELAPSSASRFPGA